MSRVSLLLIVLAGSLLWVSPASAVEGACPTWKAKEDVTAAKRSLARAEARLREARRVLAATQLYSDTYGAGTGRWVRASRRAGWEWSNLPILMLVVYTESHGNPSATNPSSGAAGLLQFLPAWWEGKWDPYHGPTNLRHGHKAWLDQGWNPWPWL